MIGQYHPIIIHRYSHEENDKLAKKKWRIRVSISVTRVTLVCTFTDYEFVSSFGYAQIFP
jgi:hypothetical protein